MMEYRHYRSPPDHNIDRLNMNFPIDFVRVGRFPLEYNLMVDVVRMIAMMIVTVYDLIPIDGGYGDDDDGGGYGFDDGGHGYDDCDGLHLHFGSAMNLEDPVYGSHPHRHHLLLPLP